MSANWNSEKIQKTFNKIRKEKNSNNNLHVEIKGKLISVRLAIRNLCSDQGTDDGKRS